MDKKEAILNTTLRLITEKGFHGTPMSMVAKRAKVAAGTIYHHFENKEALINELYGLLKEKMGNALKEGDTDTLNTKERFRLLWKNLFHFFVNNPCYFKFSEQYRNSPFVSGATKEENERHYQSVIDFLDRGMVSGTFRHMPIELLVSIVHGSVMSSVRLHLSGDLIMDEALLDLAVQSSWDAVQRN